MALRNIAPPRRILGIVCDHVTADCNGPACRPFRAKFIDLRASARARAEDHDLPHDELVTSKPYVHLTRRRDRALRPDRSNSHSD